MRFHRVALIVLMAGCAGVSTSEVPVTDTPVRIESPGFSILPPPGDGWFLRRVQYRGMDFIAFRKELGNPTHTIAAGVAKHGIRPDSDEYRVKPEVFAQLVESALVQSNPPPPRGRLRIIKYTVVPDSRLGYCAKETVTFEDVGSPFSKGTKEGFLLQEDVIYYCLHPDSPTVAVEINVSEHAKVNELLGQDNAAIKEIREGFVDRFQFRKLQ